MAPPDQCDAVATNPVPHMTPPDGQYGPEYVTTPPSSMTTSDVALNDENPFDMEYVVSAIVTSISSPSAVVEPAEAPTTDDGNVF